MSESGSSRPIFKSKLPRPVGRPQNGGGCGSGENRRNTPNVKSANEVKNKEQSNNNGIARANDEFKKEIVSSEDEFQADPKALESILSNRGVTSKMLSRCPSSGNPQVQSLHRSSMYYQSPSRMSMIDSHTQFKEKMKLLKEQMKSLKIKCKGTPKSGPEGTSNASTSSAASRPSSLYYQMKPLQKQPSTPTQATPVASRSQASMSERKLLSPKDPNTNRLCHTASKFSTRPKNDYLTTARGKENKVRFKLFQSPIHEITETLCNVDNGTTPSVQSDYSVIKSSSQHQDGLKVVTNKSNTAQSISIATEDNSAFTTAAFKYLNPCSESTPLPLQSVSNKYPPVMLACNTSTTLTLTNSICTPAPSSSVFSPVRGLPKTDVSTTPNLQFNKDAAIVQITPRPNTPSRIILKNKSSSLHKVPQRTISSSQCSDRTRTPQRINPAARLPPKSPVR